MWILQNELPLKGQKASLTAGLFVHQRHRSSVVLLLPVVSHQETRQNLHPLRNSRQELYRSGRADGLAHPSSARYPSSHHLKN
jgi:hypothetical protein